MDSSVKIQILDVLNNLEVIEQNGGDFPYLLVSNNEETQEKLSKLGVPKEKLISSGDEETFCILALAFNEGYANDYKNGKLVYETDKYAVYNSRTNETKKERREKRV